MAVRQGLTQCQPEPNPFINQVRDVNPKPELLGWVTNCYQSVHRKEKNKPIKFKHYSSQAQTQLKVKS